MQDATNPDEKGIKAHIARELTKSVLADIAYRADGAARVRRLRSLDHDALDVYHGATEDILRELTRGLTITDITDNVLSNKPKYAHLDPSDKDAQSLAIGLLCHRVAERIRREQARTRPEGDTVDVMGEERASAANEGGPDLDALMGNKAATQAQGDESGKKHDRHYIAVMSRPARIRGIHRTDVLAVADWSRRAMRDTATIYFAEVEGPVISGALDRNWTPRTERQREVWNLAFGTESPVDVMFGLDPTTGVHRPTTLESDDTDWRFYPTLYPYNPFKTYGRRVKDKGVKAGDVDEWRTLYVARLLPDSATSADRVALDRALRDWRDHFNAPGTDQVGKSRTWNPLRQYAADDAVQAKDPYRIERTTNPYRRGTSERWTLRSEASGVLSEFWKAQTAYQRYLHDERCKLEDLHLVGQGTTIWPNAPLAEPIGLPILCHNYSDDEGNTGKEGKRWAFLDAGVERGVFGMVPTPDNTAHDTSMGLPSADRINDTRREMLEGWVQISHEGNFWVDGLNGKFVQGLPGVVEAAIQDHQTKKFLRVICNLFDPFFSERLQEVTSPVRLGRHEAVKAVLRTMSGYNG